ncbi:helix-turn-helix domain-containing protein [Puniceicoccus vermicola]|uniref:Helix-turn-helix transcriptional regulator n=2 Tax=Puniceicoccus vermicola TaxID=388746 RepID=A0A7X1E4U6_9BACT|nr:helix-turn-helix transcriptional regulator [Puniceicoccus vermicola]
MHQWATLQTELLWVYDGTIEHLANRSKNDHQNAYWVWLVRKGFARVSSKDTELIAQPNQWLLTPNRVNFQEFGSGTRILSVHFRAQWPSGENLFEEKDGLVIDAGECPVLERCAVSMQKAAARHFSHYHSTARAQIIYQNVSYEGFWLLQRHFLRWMTAFTDVLLAKGYSFAETGAYDPRLLKAVRSLHEAPLNKSLPETQVQQLTGLSRARLDYLFVHHFGISMREYWNRLRLQSAKHCLADTQLIIKEISYRLGFKQPSYFTRWFQSQAKCSPREYRNEFSSRA